MSLPPRSEWRRLYRYWVRDPLAGARLVALHEGMRALPTGMASAIGGRLGRFAGPRLHAAADRRARATLALLRPDLAADPAIARMWDAQGRAYAEFSVEDRLWPRGQVSVTGEQHLARRKLGDPPLIVAGVHLGNWELVPIMLGYLGHDVADVYQPQRNRFEDRIAERSRLRAAAQVRKVSGAELTLLPPSPTVGAELVRALQSGATLMMYVDEFVRGRVHAPSFGRPVRSDGNLGRAARLARLAGAAIVPAYAERLPGPRYVVHFLPPVALQRTADRKADLLANVAALDAAVTAPVRDHIEQWFMLPDFRIER